MTCPACTAAQSSPLRHDYASGCDSCQARAVAAVGLHREPIKPEVLALFKDAEAGKRLVKEWGEKVDRARKVSG